MFSATFRRTWRLVLVLAGIAAPLTASGEEIALDAQTLPVELGVGYAVRLVDVNADKKPDIVIVDQKRVIWLENPDWKVHTICGENDTKADNVCLAEADIDGDGRLDLALGADWKPGTPAFTTQGGTIQWLQAPSDPRTPWKVHAIGEEPSTHRMRFADITGDGRTELIVAPLQGRGTTPPKWMENGVRVLAYEIPSSPESSKWEPRVLFDELHVIHNFQPVDINGDGKLEMLVVSFEGVFLAEPPAEKSTEKTGGKWRLTKIGTGDQESSPNRGASEIKLGRLAGGVPYIATIEPWHGDKVVVYTPPKESRPASGDWLWTRTVVDAQLKWGHAVWCTNLDGDADEELVIGVRDNLSGEDAPRCGVRIYDPVDASIGKWSRQLVDAGGVAVEDLAAADLDGDGRQDIVAVGRATHNAKIYWNRPAKK